MLFSKAYLDSRHWGSDTPTLTLPPRPATPLLGLAPPPAPPVEPHEPVDAVGEGGVAVSEEE